jgi:hypothetical protein
VPYGQHNALYGQRKRGRSVMATDRQKEAARRDIAKGGKDRKR